MYTYQIIRKITDGIRAYVERPTVSYDVTVTDISAQTATLDSMPTNDISALRFCIFDFSNDDGDERVIYTADTNSNTVTWRTEMRTLPSTPFTANITSAPLSESCVFIGGMGNASREAIQDLETSNYTPSGESVIITAVSGERQYDIGLGRRSFDSNFGSKPGLAVRQWEFAISLNYAFPEPDLFDIPDSNIYETSYHNFFRLHNQLIEVISDSDIFVSNFGTLSKGVYVDTSDFGYYPQYMGGRDCWGALINLADLRIRV